ncbi:hypothetical protein [Streptomyces sp. S1]|uniref:hypothetical protein n=1 Tax=Streptomyces sp. S1 TaxID=718288 RepID=UPI003D71D1D3
MASDPAESEQAAEGSALNQSAPKTWGDPPGAGRRRNLVTHSTRSGKTTSLASVALAASRANPKANFYGFKGSVGRSSLVAHTLATTPLILDVPTTDPRLHDLGKRDHSWQLPLRYDSTRLPNPFLGRGSQAPTHRTVIELIERYNASIARHSVFLSGEAGKGAFSNEARRPEKPLIEQIKARMTSAEAQRMSERLKAEDGPKRKLPPRP